MDMAEAVFSFHLGTRKKLSFSLKPEEENVLVMSSQKTTLLKQSLDRVKQHSFAFFDKI